MIFFLYKNFRTIFFKKDKSLVIGKKKERKHEK